MYVTIVETKKKCTRMRCKPRHVTVPIRKTEVQLFTADETIPEDPAYGEVRDITPRDEHLLNMVFGRKIKITK